MASFNYNINPGFIFELTSKPKLDLSEFGIKDKEKKGSLHIYIASQTSQTTPFDNARFRRIFNKADVIVTLQPESKLDQQLPSLRDEEFSQMNEKLDKILEQNEIREFQSEVLESKSKAETIIKKTIVAMLLQANKTLPKDSGNETKKVFFPEKIILEKATREGKEVTHIYKQPYEAIDASKVFSPEFLCPFLELACGENDIVARQLEAKVNEQKLCDRGDWKALQKKITELNVYMDEAEKKLDQSTLNHLKDFQICGEDRQVPIFLKLGFKIQKYINTRKNHLIIIPVEQQLNLEKVRTIANFCNSSDTIEIQGPFEQPKGLFWKIKSPEGKKGYLLGSIHITPDYILDLNGKIRHCFHKAKTLAVEADITREEVKKASKESEIEAMESKIADLTEDQKKQTAQRARKLLPALGHKEKIEDLEDKKAILLGISYLLKNIDISGKLGWSSGIDKELIRQAKERKLEIVDLEDWKLHTGCRFSFLRESALNILSQPDFPNLQNQELEKILGCIGDQLADDLKNLIGPKVNDWERGNLEAMDHSKTDSPKNRREMISRNNVMANSIADLIEEKKYPFAVVGAAHMAGEMSILNFLEQYKFTVTRKCI